MADLNASLAPGQSIYLATDGPVESGIAVRRLDSGIWEIQVDMGQRVVIRKCGGPVRAAAIRLRCSTDRGWVVERQMRDWDMWVEWCVVPRLLPLDWDPRDQDAFVDEDYAEHERDFGQDPPPHLVAAWDWREAWKLRVRAQNWRREMRRIREPEPDDIRYVVGNADEWARLLGLDEFPKDAPPDEDEGLPF